MNFNEMSLNQKFAQMIMIGLDFYDLDDEVIKFIKEYKIGGVVLYKKNYTSIESMTTFINKLKKINENNIPLFIAIDQENGRVNRFPKEIPTIYSPLKQAYTRDLKIINTVNDITSYLLKSVGVNMNFAPCLDIVRSEKNKAIGNRSYGSTFEDVCLYGIPFMENMKKHNIISVVKHFPGHGASNKDSHLLKPEIKDLKTLEKEDIIPFEYAIKKGVDAIMVGHLIIKGYGLKPASINKNIIDDYLINRYNYNGLIISDDIRMNASRDFTGLKRRIFNAINAGNDIVMIKYKKNDIKMYKKLFKNINKINPEIINNSSKKILDIKNKYNLTNKENILNIDINKVNEKIKEINKIIIDIYNNK